MRSFPKTVLIIIDGFGFNPSQEGNAVDAAKTPNLDTLWSSYPHTLVKASGEEVGLLFGQIGNSEVCHMAIGTGRVMPSPLVRINAALEDRSFYNNPAFTKAIDNSLKNASKLHLIGMLSNAGVHADINHFIALMELAKGKGVKNLYLHPIIDGRDTGPKDASIYLEMLSKAIARLGVGKIASISGRAYAMDRNKNWDRTQKYFNVLMGVSQMAPQSASEALQKAYGEGLDDETAIPTLLDPAGTLSDGDSVIITNFREDRMRQLAHALTDKEFVGFKREKLPSNLIVVTMTEYEKGLSAEVAFPFVPATNTLSDTLEQNGVTQLHIAETEKYAHVTYFLNGGREKALPHEEFVQVPSDPPNKFLENPAMQASKITDIVLSDLDSDKHTFIVLNFANPDMIGHTGDLAKTITAIETVDEQVSKIAEKVFSQNGYLFVTSDHGNAELMIDLKTHKPAKDHTINPVPFIMASPALKGEAAPTKVCLGSNVTGILQDVAPTILTRLGIAVPEEMTGVNLF